ncbi:pilus assembly protein N-terminal domain-containing protein [Helicobacter sp. 11S02596-1]|uniref:type II and III secretion system protein family protein n=1 Tax=Helicobacter sp. 11S02596-1 TaxID=1476194 RepID=UPI000BCBB405|nr:pilus assembly protein N-terminal domain-containing protein [Helicobacter sp. 11S02596-1]PAF43636.1 hypothetical protein BJI48_05110 [Helicobacter sp. 11S02596-1]
MVKNKFKLFFIFVLLGLCLAGLNAKEIVLKKGGSKLFKTSQEITAAFVSDPKILDYKIISQHQIIIYGNDLGTGSVKVFGKANALLLEVNVSVDSTKEGLEELAKLIEAKLPDSTIKIDKLALPDEIGYIISGEVPDEGSRDIAYNMAAAALGVELEKIEKKPLPTNATSQRTNSDGENDDDPLKFLTRYESELLVDHLKIKLNPQVNVKLIVADVEKNLISKLGIDFNSGTAAIPIVQMGQFLNFSQFNFLAVVDALQDDQSAKILAQPNLSVMSGESAKFSVLGQYTPITNSVTYGGQAVSSPGTAKDYGISLTIQPKVYSRDKIVVRISQEVSNIQSIIERNGASAANLKKRQAESVIQVADGESFIIAGLLDEKDNESVRSVPFLGDIPFLGALFRKSSITRAKQELIVIATINLAKPVNKDVFIPTYQSRNIAESFFAMPYKRPKAEKQEIKKFLQNVGFVK